MITLPLAIFFMFLGINGRNSQLHREVDLVELNHVTNEEGRVVFDQFVFWRFNHETNKMEVTDWFSTADDKRWSFPCKDHNTNLFVMVVRIGKQTYVVKSQSFIETYGYDSELYDREWLQSDNRAHVLRPWE